MKYFRGLYDLKVKFLDKSFEKYNAVRTQFDNFFFWMDDMGQTVLSMIENFVFCKPEWKLDRFLWLKNHSLLEILENTT